MVRRVALAGALSWAVAASAAPHPGRVVRVERNTRKPRVCGISPADLSGYCYGARPELGQHILVVDGRRPLATLSISAVNAVAACTQQQSIWMIKGQIETGEIVPPFDPMIEGLLGVDADTRRAHLVKVETAPRGRSVEPDSIIAVDTNGDGSADLEFFGFPCDESNQPSTGTQTGTCIEAWYSTPRGFEWLSTDRVSASCF